jgi:hypothetical protein
VTWEGPAAGFGTVFDTATYVGSKSGTFSFYFAVEDEPLREELAYLGAIRSA